MLPISNKSLEFAIVVIAYNRLESLKRIFSSLLSADYLGDKVDLVISIDNSGSDILIRYADSVHWPFGEKKVISHQTRLGLKQHVLKCGSLTQEYENICVLEDDLFVSPGFYAYAKSASRHFNSFDDIAGISLYSHQWNQYSNKPFSPVEDKHDIYLMQMASSWGQVWNRKKWQEFTVWLDGKDDESLHTNQMPNAVSRWSSKSWLKFHNRYLVDSSSYFVYPKQSLTTNFSDPGEHAVASTTYQVPLLLDIKIDYRFPEKLENAQRYDAFFENLQLASFLNISDAELDVNLYGTRFCEKRYLLTTEVLDYKIVRSFALKLKPIEVNIFLNMPGREIYLYDKSIYCKSSGVKFKAAIERFMYEIKSNDKKMFFLAACYLYLKAVIRRLRF